MWRVSAAALVCVTWLAAARPVCAQNVPRVSLVPLSGALQAEVQRDVVAALALHSSDIEFVSVTTFSATLGNSHSAHDDTDTLNAARALHLDAIVDGGVFRGASRRHVLRLRVRSVADGSILGSGAWAFRRGTEVRGLRGDIWDQLHDALTGSVHAATPPPHQTEPAAEDPPPASPAAAAPARSVEPEPAHESTPQPTPSGIEPPSAPLHTGVAPTPGLGIVWAQLLGGVGMRSWSVPVLGDIAPRGYENQGYPEGGAEIMALYRFDDERAGVGVSAGGAIPVSISSSGVDANGNMVSVPTQAFEVWGGVAAAYRPPGGGLMRVQIGAFMHSFSLDTSMLPPSQQLASIAYLGGRVAAEGVLPLVRRPLVRVGVALRRRASRGSSWRWRSERVRDVPFAGDRHRRHGRFGIATRRARAGPRRARVRGASALSCPVQWSFDHRDRQRFSRRLRSLLRRRGDGVWNASGELAPECVLTSPAAESRI